MNFFLQMLEDEKNDLQEKLTQLEKEAAKTKEPKKQLLDLQEKLHKQLCDATSLNEQLVNVLKQT